MSKRSEPRREAFWRRMLQRRTKSGMTVTKFCAKENLAESAFYYWQRQIRRRDAESPAGKSNSPDESTFVPVQLLDDRNNSTPVEIVTTNGYVIRVGAGATTDQVRQVLQAVGTVG